MKCRVIACSCLPGLAGAACAQETVTFDIRFSDPILTPGETQQIEVWAILAPGIGGSATWNTNGGIGQAGIVKGIGGARFDLSSVSNGQTGFFTELALNPSLALFYPPSLGTPDGEGNVVGIEFVQSPYFGQLLMSSPVLLWSCTWTPSGYSPRKVDFTTHQGADPFVYLELFPYNGSWGYPDTWTPLTPSASFQVVPAPGAGALLGLGFIPLARRRRRCRPD